MTKLGLRLAMALVGTFGLSGCLSMPIPSMLSLGRVNFENTDIERLRVGVTAPSWIRPRPGQTRLDVTIRIGDFSEARSFRLEQMPNGEDAAHLRAAAGPNGAAFVFRLTPPDALALTRERKAMFARRRETDQAGSIAFSVSPKLCHVGNQNIQGASFRTWLMSAETKEFVALTYNMDVRELLDASNGALVIPPCTAPLVTKPTGKWSAHARAETSSGGAPNDGRPSITNFGRCPLAIMCPRCRTPDLVKNEAVQLVDGVARPDRAQCGIVV